MLNFVSNMVNSVRSTATTVLVMGGLVICPNVSALVYFILTKYHRSLISRGVFLGGCLRAMILYIKG